MYKIVNRKKWLSVLLADNLGRLLSLPWTLLRRSEPVAPETVRSILLIRTAYIGDVIMTLPMLRPLKERFPESRITVLTALGAAPLLQGHPYADEVVTFAPFWFYRSANFADYLRFIRAFRRRQFDLVIEARGDIRDILLLAAPLRSRFKVSYGIGGGAYLLTHVVPYPGLRHKVEYHLDICRFLGCPDKPLDWGLHLTAEEQTQARQLLERLGVSGPFLCAHPGSRLPLKTWPEERCAALYDLLLERFGLPLLLLGGADDQARIERIMAMMRGKAVSLAGRTSLREMAAVLQKASLFVCNDSAPMHLAAALNTPTVALFGPSKSAETRPFSARSVVVEEDFSCRFACDESSCRRAVKQDCMKAITPEAVLRAAETLLGGAGRQSGCTGTN
uniref:glycosyltransferase family 9 protein n=1 Tax=Candidatus Electronema sp. TaxID=2698783 RepID=UPI0040575EF6